MKLVLVLKQPFKDVIYEFYSSINIYTIWFGQNGYKYWQF